MPGDPDMQTNFKDDIKLTLSLLFSKRMRLMFP